MRGGLMKKKISKIKKSERTQTDLGLGGGGGLNIIKTKQTQKYLEKQSKLRWGSGKSR